MACCPVSSPSTTVAAHQQCGASRDLWVWVWLAAGPAQSLRCMCTVRGSYFIWICQPGCTEPREAGEEKHSCYFTPRIAPMELVRLSSTIAETVFCFCLRFHKRRRRVFFYFPAKVQLETTEGFWVTRQQWWVSDKSIKQRSFCLSSAFSVN